MSNASDRDELEGLAGEYVLGTLSAAERLAAEARLKADPVFRAAVAVWSARLQPLAESAPPVALHPGLFDKIAARVVPVGAAAGALSMDTAPATVVTLQRQVSRWKVTTFLTGMAAIALLFVAIGDRMVPSANPPRQFVAVLNAEGAKAAFVATINLDSQTLVIRRLVDAAQPDRSFELWAIAGNNPPQSLGVIEQARYTTNLPVAPANITLAVTLEQKGGSPTGMPMGPVVFSGTLIAGT